MWNEREIECEFEMAYLHIYSIYARVLLIFPNFVIKLSHTRKIEATEDVEMFISIFWLQVTPLPPHGKTVKKTRCEGGVLVVKVKKVDN